VKKAYASRLIWNSAQDTISCVTDPRCVAAGQYVPPVDGEDLSVGVPEEELGVIPIWALNVVDYVRNGAGRPESIQSLTPASGGLNQKKSRIIATGGASPKRVNGLTSPWVKSGPRRE
jgi:hypothetical protein